MTENNKDVFPAGFQWLLDGFGDGGLYYQGTCIFPHIDKTPAVGVAHAIKAHIVIPAVEEATRELREELAAAREQIARLQGGLDVTCQTVEVLRERLDAAHREIKVLERGQARAFPPGFFFDPYQGEGFGCLRHEGLPFKVVDDVDEAEALRYAKTLAGVAEKPEEGPGMSLHLMSVEIDGVQQPVYHVPRPGDGRGPEYLALLHARKQSAERLDLLWDAGEAIAWLKADLAAANRKLRDVRAACRKIAAGWSGISQGVTADIRHIEGIVQNPLPAPTPREFPVVGTYDPPPENYTGIYIEETDYSGPLAYGLAFAFHGDDSAETLEEAQALAREYQELITTTDGWGG